MSSGNNPSSSTTNTGEQSSSGNNGNDQAQGITTTPRNGPARPPYPDVPHEFGYTPEVSFLAYVNNLQQNPPVYHSEPFFSPRPPSARLTQAQQNQRLFPSLNDPNQFPMIYGRNQSFPASTALVNASNMQTGNTGVVMSPFDGLGQWQSSGPNFGYKYLPAVGAESRNWDRNPTEMTLASQSFDVETGNATTLNQMETNLAPQDFERNTGTPSFLDSDMREEPRIRFGSSRKQASKRKGRTTSLPTPIGPSVTQSVPESRLAPIPEQILGQQRHQGQGAGLVNQTSYLYGDRRRVPVVRRGSSTPINIIPSRQQLHDVDVYGNNPTFEMRVKQLMKSDIVCSYYHSESYYK